MSDESSSRIPGILKAPIKLKEGASLTMSGLTLASVMWAVGLLYQNFSRVQDQLVDSQSKTVVLEQQVGALKDKVTELNATVTAQQKTATAVQSLETKMQVFMSTTELRLAKVESDR